ncbi:MAG TPA: hypothetical protein VGD71_00150 [Kribbella sp.]
MPAAENLVCGGEGGSHIPDDIDFFLTDRSKGSSDSHHAGHGVVVVGKWHRDTGRTERGDCQQLPAIKIGATELGGCHDGIITGAGDLLA